MALGQKGAIHSSPLLTLVRRQAPIELQPARSAAFSPRRAEEEADAADHHRSRGGPSRISHRRYWLQRRSFWRRAPIAVARLAPLRFDRVSIVRATRHIFRAKPRRAPESRPLRRLRMRDEGLLPSR